MRRLRGVAEAAAVLHRGDGKQNIIHHFGCDLSENPGIRVAQVTAGTRCYATASPYGWTAGSVVWSPVLMHLGWPKPPALLPVPPLGLGTMS
jgi:hypothetical protein